MMLSIKGRMGRRLKGNKAVARDRHPNIEKIKGGAEKEDDFMQDQGGPPKIENTGSVNTNKGKGFDFGPVSSQNDFVIGIEEKLGKVLRAGTKNWRSCSIFKIPKGLRDVDPDSYSPKIVSIGPLHRFQLHLMPMEEHKWRFLVHMLTRTSRSLDFYVSAISELKDRARHCYSWRTEDEIKDEAFVQMLLLDACFIVEILLGTHFGHTNQGYPLEDPIFAARGVLTWIQRDLLMLENQIPLFVVDRVLEITTSCGLSAAILALPFFESSIPGYIDKPNALAESSREEIKNAPHLLGVLRKCVVPSQWLGMSALAESSREEIKNAPHLLGVLRKCVVPSQWLGMLCKSANPAADPQQAIPPVSTLRDSGVKFVKKESARLTEVEFDLDRGTLQVPLLVVDDAFSAFLNLLAFEQCYPLCDNELSLYVSLMDDLIDGPRDVAHLQEVGIIDNGLGSHKAVAGLFNRICREIVVNIPDSQLAKLEDNLKLHLGKRWPSWKVSLKREHFRHPWSILSVAAAVILLILTIMQVVYAMIAYHLPP